MVIVTTLTSIGIAALLSLLGWTLRRLVTGIDARFSGIDDRFDRIDGRLDRFDDRFDRFDDSLKELRADMKTQNKELRADIASLREDHARLEGKLDGLWGRAWLVVAGAPVVFVVQGVGAEHA